MSTAYRLFLDSKIVKANPSGFDVAESAINPTLKPFQRAVVRWALKQGRSALFEECGLGKTFQQIEWARHVADRCGPVLILAPLAVTHQTVEEGKKFGIPVTQAQDQSEVRNSRIVVTNYDRLALFEPAHFAGIVLDESSILKALTGSIKKKIIESFQDTPYKLACSATPAPNDHMELGNHSEFLNVMNTTDMLSRFFVHDGGDTSKWRLKGHAQKEFWHWVASWAVCISRPSDIGFSDEGYILPELNVEHMTVSVDHTHSAGDQLFRTGMLSATTLHEEMRLTTDDRAACASRLVATKPNEPWIVWCNTNYESEALIKLLPEATEVRGSESSAVKERKLSEFSHGRTRVIITKPSIAGFGLNWQHCPNMAFVGLSYSYEQQYQAMRRSYRFGQTRTVNVYVIAAETEGSIAESVKRKEKEHKKMQEAMVSAMGDTQLVEFRQEPHIQPSPRTEVGEGWQVTLGDSVDEVGVIPCDSIHYSIYSPPFASLYTYSASERDMGNSGTYKEFLQHYRFLVRELYRVTMPGRLLSFHCMNLPTSKERDGVIGLRDFRGRLIREHERAGFIFHSEVVIWKDPVVAMQRTKAIGLLYKQLRKDSAMSRQGIPDYLVTMRKPGVNPEPVTKTHQSFPVDLWQRYASPVWMDIDPGDTLQKDSAREHEDERHICPLQLTVINRGVRLWTNPGDTVLSPFAGIGSEGHEAIKLGRKFIGCELKESYFKQACLNLASVASTSQGNLFGDIELSPDEYWAMPQTDAIEEVV